GICTRRSGAPTPRQPNPFVSAAGRPAGSNRVANRIAGGLGRNGEVALGTGLIAAIRRPDEHRQAAEQALTTGTGGGPHADPPGGVLGCGPAERRLRFAQWPAREGRPMKIVDLSRELYHRTPT